MSEVYTSQKTTSKYSTNKNKTQQGVPPSENKKIRKSNTMTANYTKTQVRNMEQKQEEYARVRITEI